MKAAYLLNFARFTTWPSDAFLSPEEPIVLCIIGETPIEEALSTIAQKKVQKRALKFIKLKSGDTIPQTCHMLLVGDMTSQSVLNMTRSIASRPILTISSKDGFSTSGGMITLVKINNKIRFQINLTTTEKAGLSMSSRLLKLATVVGP